MEMFEINSNAEPFATLRIAEDELGALVQAHARSVVALGLTRAMLDAADEAHAAAGREEDRARDAVRTCVDRRKDGAIEALMREKPRRRTRP